MKAKVTGPIDVRMKGMAWPMKYPTTPNPKAGTMIVMITCLNEMSSSLFSLGRSALASRFQLNSRMIVPISRPTPAAANAMLKDHMLRRGAERRALSVAPMLMPI